MADIHWEEGDFFAYSHPLNPGGAKLYGIVKVVAAADVACILIRDNGMRTGRYSFAFAWLPKDAVPSDLTGADFPVKMALYGIKFQMVKLGMDFRVA